MKFIYITKPLPVFNKKFRENSGNPSSMFIYKKNGYKEKTVSFVLRVFWPKDAIFCF